VVLTTNGNGYNLLAKSCHTPNEKVLKKVHSKKRLLSTFRRKRSFWPYNERVRFGRTLSGGKIEGSRDRGRQLMRNVCENGRACQKWKKWNWAEMQKNRLRWMVMVADVFKIHGT